MSRFCAGVSNVFRTFDTIKILFTIFFLCASFLKNTMSPSNLPVRPSWRICNGNRRKVQIAVTLDAIASMSIKVKFLLSDMYQVTT